MLSIRTSEKTLKFDNIRVNKKEFHKSKQPIDLGLVNVDQIVVSDKFKHSDDGFEYFIGYKEGKIVKPLCIILSQMTGYIPKFDNIRVNKKEFHKSKQPIDLSLVNVDQIIVSDKFKHSDDGFKYFIGYREGEIVKPLCMILPQMTGYKKYFENRGKNMSFVIRDENLQAKSSRIFFDAINITLTFVFWLVYRKC